VEGSLGALRRNSWLTPPPATARAIGVGPRCAE